MTPVLTKRALRVIDGLWHIWWANGWRKLPDHLAQQPSSVAMQYARGFYRTKPREQIAIEREGA